ncbi:MAG: molybdopterin molybdotransferase MoeA [Nocardioides sp.]|uniref:molybdotransferase-like divisome protein Glp n=1 Tax=Nocardioides sp. TaxID=35761 RepID=UPI0039E4F600
MTPDEYQDRILAEVAPMAAFPQRLLDCVGLASAEEVRSGVSLPGFDNSAMDGYAVRYADVRTACADEPVRLPVVGEIGAGRADLLALPSGSCAKIMTGAPMPTGADAVVPYEWTDRGAAWVSISQAPAEHQHVRYAGEDVAVGDLVIAEGTVLGPRHLGLLACVGRDRIATRPRPRVVVISTGSELREPGQQLGHGAIYDGNSYLLAAAARRVGALPTRVGIVADSPAAFLGTLEDQLLRADLVITSGGVSMGDYDVVKEALAPRGVWFGSVAMQPGKPQGFGHLGPDRVPIFCLPGNPVSSFVSFELFVRPALRRLMGIAPEVEPTLPATLTHDVPSPKGRRQYLRGHYDGTHATVSPVGGPGSHLIGDLAQADALLIVPAETTLMPAGSRVEVIVLQDTP